MVNGENNFNLLKNKRNANKEDWSNLLPEILSSVMSRLIVRDNIRASSVCKEWYKSNVSNRIKNRHLWLMMYPTTSRNIRAWDLYDPSQKTTYTLEFPELLGKSIYYSKDGWLLMHKYGSYELCFFNPFSRKLISLPKCESYNQCAMFTCAPTSNDCLVIRLTNMNKNKRVEINTFKLGESKWKSSSFLTRRCFLANYYKIIFLEGLFYFLGSFGSLAIFDPSKRTLNTRKINYRELGLLPLTSSKTYFVEIKGDIFLIKTLGEKLRVFRLNRDVKDWIWEEKDRFDEGLTVFGASPTSEYRLNLEDCMKDKIILSGYDHSMINTYYFDEGRYLQDHLCIKSWNIDTFFQSVWIEPPKQSLDFI